MNRHVNAISGRLSLRPPRRHSIEILHRITELVPPHKGTEVTSESRPFELDLSSLRYPPISEEPWVQLLRTGRRVACLTGGGLEGSMTPKGEEIPARSRGGGTAESPALSRRTRTTNPDMHKVRRFPLKALLAVTVLGAAGLLGEAGAAGKSRKGVGYKTKGKASELPTVTAVGKDHITVRGKTYQVRDDAEITVNGEPAGLSQLRKGMQVLVTSRVLEYGRGSDDTTYEARRIVASTDNHLARKAAAFNKKAHANARKRLRYRRWHRR